MYALYTDSLDSFFEDIESGSTYTEAVANNDDLGVCILSSTLIATTLETIYASYLEGTSL